MAQRKDNLKAIDLALPQAASRAMPLARATAQPATWADQIVAHTHPVVAVDFGARLFRRFDTASTPGIWAATFAQRFTPGTIQPATLNLTLAPYAPPLRHLSTVRQGTYNWAAPTDAASTLLARAAAEPTSADEPLLGDLAELGWGRQIANNSPYVPRAAEQPMSSLAATQEAHGERADRSIQEHAIHRVTNARQQPEHTQSVQAAPEVQRWSEMPLAVSEQPTRPSAERSTEVVGPASTTEAEMREERVENELPPLQTAATRPMLLFRQPAPNPLERMGRVPMERDAVFNPPGTGDWPVAPPAQPSLVQPPDVTSANTVNRTTDSTAARQTSPAMPMLQPSARPEVLSAASAHPESATDSSTSTADTGDLTSPTPATAAVPSSSVPATDADHTTSSGSVQPPTVDDSINRIMTPPADASHTHTPPLGVEQPGMVTASSPSLAPGELRAAPPTAAESTKVPEIESQMDAPQAEPEVHGDASELPPLQTAATRPMTLLRQPSLDPLLRMGLSTVERTDALSTAVSDTSTTPTPQARPLVQPATSTPLQEGAGTAHTRDIVARQLGPAASTPEPGIQPAPQNSASLIQASAAAQPTTTANSPAGIAKPLDVPADIQTASVQSAGEDSVSAAPTTAAPNTEAPASVSAVHSTHAGEHVTPAAPDMESPAAVRDAVPAHAAEQTTSPSAASSDATTNPPPVVAEHPTAEQIARMSADPGRAPAGMPAYTDTSTVDSVAVSENEPVIWRWTTGPQSSKPVYTLQPLALTLLRRYHSTGAVQALSPLLLRTLAPDDESGMSQMSIPAPRLPLPEVQRAAATPNIRAITRSAILPSFPAPLAEPGIAAINAPRSNSEIGVGIKQMGLNHAFFGRGTLPALGRAVETQTLRTVSLVARTSAPFLQLSSSDDDHIDAQRATEVDTATWRNVEGSTPLPLLQRLPWDYNADQGETSDMDSSFAETYSPLGQADSARTSALAGPSDSGPGTALELLRPARTADQTVSGSVSARNSGMAGAGLSAIGAGEGASSGEASSGQTPPDIEVLARQVYSRLRRRLMIDLERAGR